MGPWEGFSGINHGYVLELYERFRNDPGSVDSATRAIFEQWIPPQESGTPAAAVEGVRLRTAVNAGHLAQSIRRYGHLAAQLDPLGSRPPGDPSLSLETHGVTEADLRRLPANLITSALTEGAQSMQEVVDA